MSGNEPEAQVPPTGVGEIVLFSEEWYEDWPAFKEHMKAHEESTLQLFCMRSSTSVSHRNNDLRGQAAANNCPDPRLISVEFKTYRVKLICTHGWKRKSGRTGQRKSYFSKSTECKADVKATVVRNEHGRKFMVRVTGCNTQHNHRVGRSVYDNHPSVRRVEDPVILAFVDVMQSAGSKPKRIMQFLREKTGKNVTFRDVHSMVSRMREERRGSETVEQRLESLLRGFCERRGNRASVYVDDEDLAQTITIQTRQMRRWFKAFLW
ncbi:ABC transporter, partial [Phytophthora megakarya]